MDPAHTRDPEELPRALLHVHERHMRATGPAPGGDGRLALRPGAAVVIFGNGVVHHVGAPGPGDTGARGKGRGVRTAVPVGDGKGAPGHGPARQSLARLSYGFCTRHLVPAGESEIAPLLTKFRYSIIPFMINRRQVGVCSATFDVDGGAIDDPDPKGLIDAVMSEVWPIEDERCAGQLGRLPRHDRGPERCRGAADIAGFVAGLGDGDGPRGRLDTAFVSPPLMRSLRREPGEEGYENVMRAAGVSIISSQSVPEGTMYVTSSLDGPVFINGPTVLRREGDRLVVARYCASHGPTGDAPGRESGLAMRVDR